MSRMHDYRSCLQAKIPTFGFVILKQWDDQVNEQGPVFSRRY
jgi:hypothetical protein